MEVVSNDLDTVVVLDHRLETVPVAHIDSGSSRQLDECVVELESRRNCGIRARSVERNIDRTA